MFTLKMFQSSKLTKLVLLIAVFMFIASFVNEVKANEEESLKDLIEAELISRNRDYSTEAQKYANEDDSMELSDGHAAVNAYLKARSLANGKKGFNSWAGRSLDKRGFNAWAGKRSAIIPLKFISSKSRRAPWGGSPSE